MVRACAKGTFSPSAMTVLTLTLSLNLSLLTIAWSRVRLSSATLLAPQAMVVGPVQTSPMSMPSWVKTRRARLFLTMCRWTFFLSRSSRVLLSTRLSTPLTLMTTMSRTPSNVLARASICICLIFLLIAAHQLYIATAMPGLIVADTVIDLM